MGEPGRASAPLWVRLSLLQITTRRVAMGFVELCVLLGTAGVAFGLFFDPIFILGTLFYVAAGLYWGAVRWMDSHKAW